jgi:hypothetical protein
MGSGTLVELGQVVEILTAAHVVHMLPESGEVGIGQVRQGSSLPQRLKLEMAHTQSVVLWQEDQPDGPDLAFLRLPPDTTATLRATRNVYNLGKRRDDSFIPGITLEAIIGVIGEWTTHPANDADTRRVMNFETFYAVGETSNERSSNGYDFFDFRCDPPEEGERHPTTFGGTSGGAVWRLRFRRNADGRLEADRVLLGVPILQSAQVGRTRTITCHGLNSIERLKQEMKGKWPDMCGES